MKWHLRAWSELGRDDLYGILRLRTDVFVVEQNCPYPELDGRDAEALHVWAEDELGVVACARVLPGPVIGRVVTRADVRGKGVGYALMERALAACPPGPVHLSAQAHLEGFYRTFGFAVSGPGYLEDGIPHVPMDAAGTPAARGIDRLSEAERRYRIETADLLFDDGGWDVRQTSTHLRLVAEFFRSQIAKNSTRWEESRSLIPARANGSGPCSRPCARRTGSASRRACRSRSKGQILRIQQEPVPTCFLNFPQKQKTG